MLDDTRTPLAFVGSLATSIGALIAVAAYDAPAAVAFATCAIYCACEFGASVRAHAACYVADENERPV